MQHSSATLLAQATQGAQAWSILLSQFNSITSTSLTEKINPTNPITNALGTTATASSDATLQSAYSCLSNLHLTPLLISHIQQSILQPYIERHLINELFWRRIDAFIALQYQLFGSVSAPRRFHPKLNEWILKIFTQAVHSLHTSYQHLFSLLTHFDRIIQRATSTDSTTAEVSFVQLLFRMMRREFERSLEVRCTPEKSESDSDIPLPSSSPLPLRSTVLSELMFKYYRLNFRAFYRVCSQKKKKNASQQPDTSDDTNMNTDENTTAAEETQEQEDEASLDATIEQSEDAEPPVDAVNTSQSEDSPSSILKQFIQTCRFLLDMNFIGGEVGDVCATSADATNPSSTTTTTLLPVPSILSPSYYLDFFFLLITKYLHHTTCGIWHLNDQLGRIEEWMRERVKRFVRIILTGEDREVDDTTTAIKGDITTTHTSRLTSFHHTSSRLHFYCLSSLGSIRIHDELFGMIKVYPESIPALMNLSELLQVTKQYEMLIESVSGVIRTRLLQPSNTTADILQQYVNLIQVCRLLDVRSENNLLSRILSQSGITVYVRQRSDTVRAVVNAIWGGMEKRKMDDDGEDEEKEEKEQDEEKEADAEDAPEGLDLLHELESVPASTQYGDDSDGEDDSGAAAVTTASGATVNTAASAIQERDDAWIPDPSGGGGGALMSGLGVSGSVPTASSSISTSISSGAKTSRYLRTADILSLLIDLCGTSERNEEVLLVEYKQFVAEKMLGRRGNVITPESDSVINPTSYSLLPYYNVETHITHLELMKLRFGDTQDSLVQTEVMLKDVMNSKRMRVQVAGGVEVEVVKERNEEEMKDDDQQVTEKHTMSMMHARLRTAYEEQLAAASDPTSSTPSMPPSSAAQLQHALSLSTNFNALLLSSEFWPENQLVADDESDEFTFKLPASLQQVYGAYSSLYHTFKNPRQLEWLHSLPANRGNRVEIEIDRIDGTTEVVECEPIHVAILDLFAEEVDAGEEEAEEKKDDSTTKSQWKFSDLLTQLEMDDNEDILKAKLAFWVQRSVLRTIPNEEEEDDVIYELIEVKVKSEEGDDADEEDALTSGNTATDHSLLGNGLSEKQQRSLDAQVESYVLGSLGNFASLTLERLQNMMKTISTNVKEFLYTKNEAELKVLLGNMEARGLVVQKDGGWTKLSASKG